MRRYLYPLLCLLLCLALMAGCAKKVAEPGGTPTIGDQDGEAKIIVHEVAAGETLRQIADNYYGDPEHAQRIAADNEIADANRIMPGSVLRLQFSGRQWTDAQRRAAALEPYNRGVDLLAQDKLGEAEQQFRLAVETAPDLLVARYNLALVLLKRGQHAAALEHLVELTELRPQDTDFRFARGHALFLQTEFDAAAEQFQLVLDVAPAHQRAAFGLARSLQEAGHKGQAETAWERYLELDATSSWATAARRNLQQLRDGGD